MNDDTQLARWLAGELDAQELEALKKSPRYAMLVRIKENFTLIERPQINADEMMETIFTKEKNVPKVIPLHRRLWFRTVAASIVLLLGLGIIFTLPQKVSASNGSTMAFTLPDGSEVLLNSGSESSYSSWKWDSNRTINLDGEAYFEVAKGKTFTVNTSLGKVTVLGTHFNVKARQNRFDVVCYEGRVRVEYNGHTTVLTPHRSLTVENGIMAGNINLVPADVPTWTGTELTFSKEKFTAVIAELERKYDVKIRTDYQSNQTFTGVLPANNIDGALQSLSTLYHLKAQKQGNIILLKPVDAKR